jgi:hypothetical protein
MTEAGCRPAWPSIVELRRYRLHPGARETLIDLFEREFVETQEAVGMSVLGTFTDLDRPDNFVWLRGFADMPARAAGLTAFYTGPVWAAHRDAANATMIDSDNVLLLRLANVASAPALPAARPCLGQAAPEGFVTATIHHLAVPPSEALEAFEKKVAPRLAAAGVEPFAVFVTEASPNNFPRLPVREGEPVLVWLAAFEDEAGYRSRKAGIDDATAVISDLCVDEPEVSRLKPTPRSLIRGAGSFDRSRDFDFLFGRWAVKHRRLKLRGAGSNDWEEFSGTSKTRPVLDGLCNVEEHWMDRGEFRGSAFRCFDRMAGRWSIYWVGARDGRLQPPVSGAFEAGKGVFEGDDTDAGRPIRARFVWQADGTRSARWEQSFSYDGGATWETNWTMEFGRIAD